MYHHIEFRRDFTGDLESPHQRMQRVRIRKGERAYAYMVAYAVDTVHGPVEVADLYFEDGSVTRQVCYDRFRFLDDAVEEETA